MGLMHMSLAFWDKIPRIGVCHDHLQIVHYQGRVVVVRAWGTVVRSSGNCLFPLWLQRKVNGKLICSLTGIINDYYVAPVTIWFKYPYPPRLYPLQIHTHSEFPRTTSTNVSHTALAYPRPLPFASHPLGRSSYPPRIPIPTY